MPLYIADYLSATEHLDAAHSGAYLHLIMHYWQKGKLPAEDRFLARIARMTDRQWAGARPTLQAFFTADWRHERIDLELDKASQKAEARAVSGSRGGNAKALNNNNSTLAKATDLLEQTPSKAPSKPLPSSSGLEREDSSLRSLSPGEIEKKADEFYRAYPKHVDPKDAKAKFVKAVRAGVDPNHIILAAGRWSQACERAGTDKQFIPAPAVWLNRGSYDSEDLPSSPARAGPHLNGHHPDKPLKTNLFIQAALESQEDADRDRRAENDH